MELLYIIAIWVVLTATFAYINQRFIKLPGAVGLMAMGIIFSLLLILSGGIFPLLPKTVETVLEEIDFSRLVLDFMLSFILFAGALHTDLKKLKEAKWPILTFATFGVLVNTFAVGSLFYLLVGLFEIPISYLQCLLFGALIAPTDPIAVLGIMREANLPAKLEAKITGESLFNDGIGVVIFIILLQIAEQGTDQLSFMMVGELLIKEVVGGIVLGIILAFAGTKLMRTIDHYETEVLLTLALVLGGYSIAHYFHFSGPLAMVITGLLIGGKRGLSAMSEMTTDYMFKFWEMMDEIFNAALFLLIGLELIIIPFKPEFIILGLISIVIVLLTRYAGLAIPTYLLHSSGSFNPKALPVLTWGGLKGGISIALALSLSQEQGRDLIVAVTYIIVLFSILGQGLSMGKVINRYRSQLS